MHFEILVEDQSGKKALDILIPKILNDLHTFTVHAYKGIGRLPQQLKPSSDASHRILLDQLPKLLRGYGNTFAQYPSNYSAAVIVVCDLDNKSLTTFKTELNNLLNNVVPQPETRFCIAIEEGESWFLGDKKAIKKAYPKAKLATLKSYQHDSICGAWEKLADVVYSGGARKLSQKGWHAVGLEKSNWAARISPHMDIDNNRSPSFQYFRNRLRELIQKQLI